MNTIVKICGLNDAAALDAAIEVGADMVGFVVFAPSPRHVGFPALRAFGAQVRGRARKVALTVDADDATLAAIVESLQPDMLQLHGDETPARVAAVRARFGLPVMKAIAIGTPADLGRITAYEDVADQLLFDARAPKGADRPGGNGAAFDWSLLRGVAARRPWLLAGGLHPDNVRDAIRRTGAPGVDVSSGVEAAPGMKDIALIGRFIAQARLEDHPVGAR
jgi:phosphoribosylanthranilate isomerase